MELQTLDDFVDEEGGRESIATVDSGQDLWQSRSIMLDSSLHEPKFKGKASRGSSSGVSVPREELFVPCSDQLGEQPTPSERSCMGPWENQANVTEGCNEKTGRLHYCNTTAEEGAFTCRLCGTCRKGYAKNSMGACESCDVDNMSSILTSVGLIFLAFFMVFVLIFLKIKTF